MFLKWQKSSLGNQLWNNHHQFHGIVHCNVIFWQLSCGVPMLTQNYSCYFGAAYGEMGKYSFFKRSLCFAFQSQFFFVCVSFYIWFLDVPPETNEFNLLVIQMKSHVEKMAGENFAVYIPIDFISKNEGGINYTHVIKVIVCFYDAFMILRLWIIPRHFLFDNLMSSDLHLDCEEAPSHCIEFLCIYIR